MSRPVAALLRVAPRARERTAILAIHSRTKKLGPKVDLDAISRGTPGFSGADLVNLVNEAAINAVRARRAVISAADFDAARERLLIGRRDASNALLPEEKHAVAVHEAGHALVAIFSEKADPVAKVTILPRGAALGVTAQLPVLAEYPNALRVRLDGPLDARVARATAHEHLDESAARKLKSEIHRARDAYAPHLYGTEMTDPTHFHLYLDATAIDIDTCVDLLETMARCRLPAGAPHATPRRRAELRVPRRLTTDWIDHYRKEAT